MRSKSRQMKRQFQLSIEFLEPRQLLTVTYGDALVQIHLDEARTNFPTILGDNWEVVNIDSGVLWNNTTQEPLFTDLTDCIDAQSAWNFVNNSAQVDHDRYTTADFNIDGKAKDGNTRAVLGAPIFPHGTATSVFIVGNQHVWNSETYEGIAPQSQVIPYRVDPNARNYGYDKASQAWGLASTAALVNALDRVQSLVSTGQNTNIAAVNMCIGPWDTQALKDATKALTDDNRVVVIAASGTTTTRPTKVSPWEGSADYEKVFVVGATRTITGTTTVEVVDTNNTVFTKRVDLVAPGANLPYAWPDDATGVNTSQRYFDAKNAAFTSWSTPMVSGTVALIRQLVNDPHLTASQITSLLTSTGDRVYTMLDSKGKQQAITISKYSETTANGTVYYVPRLNVNAALAAAQNFDPGRLTVLPFDALSKVVHDAPSIVYAHTSAQVSTTALRSALRLYRNNGTTNILGPDVSVEYVSHSIRSNGADDYYYRINNFFAANEPFANTENKYRLELDASLMNDPNDGLPGEANSIEKLEWTVDRASTAPTLTTLKFNDRKWNFATADLNAPGYTRDTLLKVAMTSEPKHPAGSHATQYEVWATLMPRSPGEVPTSYRLTNRLTAGDDGSIGAVTAPIDIDISSLRSSRTVKTYELKVKVFD